MLKCNSCYREGYHHQIVQGCHHAYCATCYNCPPASIRCQTCLRAFDSMEKLKLCTACKGKIIGAPLTLGSCKVHKFCTECYRKLDSCPVCKPPSLYGHQELIEAKRCSKCERRPFDESFVAPCGHKSCLECYQAHAREILNTFFYKISSNPLVLEKQSESFGCIMKCPEYTHLYSTETIEAILSQLYLLGNERYRFENLLSGFRPYFNGIPMNFTKCKKCKFNVAYCGKYQWKCVYCRFCMFCLQYNHYDSPCPQHPSNSR